MTNFSSSTSRLLIGTVGLVMGMLAIGVYQRRLWAWSGMLAFIVASGLMSVPQLFFNSNFSHSDVLRAIFGVLSLAVTAYWGWRWYAQRFHFKRNADPALMQ